MTSVSRPVWHWQCASNMPSHLTLDMPPGIARKQYHLFIATTHYRSVTKRAFGLLPYTTTFPSKITLSHLIRGLQKARQLLPLVARVSRLRSQTVIVAREPITGSSVGHLLRLARKSRIVQQSRPREVVATPLQGWKHSACSQGTLTKLAT